MGDIPSMWRVELLHPMMVHFPIALLVAGSLAWVIGQFARGDSRWSFMLPAGRLALIAGTVFSWISVYSGTLANAEVARTLCDPRVKNVHEDLAWVTAYVFTAALAADAATVLLAESLGRWRRVLTLVVGAALLTGSGLILYVGHEGARLVYQQSAAVYQPSDRCVEFE